MTIDYSTKSSHTNAKIVLDYSFCNSSDLWNYIGIVTLVLFFSTLISYVKHRQRQKTLHHHHPDRHAWIYLSILILLALIFVIPFMCWLLTFVEVLVTFLRYGQISASPLPILSLPIRCFAFVYTKIISSIHWYLIAPGTFIFLLFFITLRYFKQVLILILYFGLPGFLVCGWVGLAIPLYALNEVNAAETWMDLAFNVQLPLLIFLKFFPLLLLMKGRIFWTFVFLLFHFGYFLKFGLTLIFLCKSLLIVVLLRFTYVIGKTFLVLVFYAPMTTNPE